MSFWIFDNYFAFVCFRIGINKNNKPTRKYFFYNVLKLAHSTLSMAAYIQAHTFFTVDLRDNSFSVYIYNVYIYIINVPLVYIFIMVSI